MQIMDDTEVNSNSIENGRAFVDCSVDETDEEDNTMVT